MKYDVSNIETSFADMPQGEPFICSFSGGKDSAIALSMACQKGIVKGLLHWSDDSTDMTTFHSQNLELIKQQADCMNIDLHVISYMPWKNRSELLHTYKKFTKQGIKSIIFGDIYVEESVKMQSILCSMAGLTPRYPLWNMSCEKLIQEISKRKIKSIITRVNTAKLNEKWLGKIFDENTYREFCSLDMDPFGEKGEFHTTVVEGDIFKKNMPYSLGENQRQGDCINIHLSTHDLANNIYKLLDR